MERRTFLRNFPKGIIIGAAAAFTLESYANSAVYEALTGNSSHEKDPNEILKEIYKEVKELGSYDNENFIKREFHMNLDGDDRNREEHVVVLISSVGDKEKMVVQVAYFEPRRSEFVKYSKEIRVVLCHIERDKIDIKRCDYNKKEIRHLLPEILQGIRYEKKLLKLIDSRGKTSVLQK